MPRVCQKQAGAELCQAQTQIWKSAEAELILTIEFVIFKKALKNLLLSVKQHQKSIGSLNLLNGYKHLLFDIRSLRIFLLKNTDWPNSLIV